MTSRLYVRQGGDEGAANTELTGFVPRKGAPFFEGDDALIQIGNRCANGEASQGQFKLLDPDAELPRVDFQFNLPAHALVTWTEDAPGSEIWLARTRNSSYDGGRGIPLVDNQVEFDATVDDCNIELRGQAFTEPWDRPEETDVERLIALQAHTLNSWDSTATDFRGTCDVTVRTDHLTPDTNTVTMPAKVYPVGTQPQDVVQDCADTAGKIFGVVIHHEGAGEGTPVVVAADTQVGELSPVDDFVQIDVTAADQLLLFIMSNGCDQADGGTASYTPDVTAGTVTWYPLTQLDVLVPGGLEVGIYYLWDAPVATAGQGRIKWQHGSGCVTTRAVISGVVIGGYTDNPIAGVTYVADNAGTGTWTTASANIAAGASDLVLSQMYVQMESTTWDATGTSQDILDDGVGSKVWGGVSEQPGAGGTTTSTWTWDDRGGTWGANDYSICQIVLPASIGSVGSHLCLFYTVETDHDTYPSPISISDHLDEWDPEDLTDPVYEPHWEAGKATLYNGQMNLSGLVNIFNQAESIYVSNPSDVAAYDYWVDPHYDSESVNLTQATLRAGGLLTYRRLTQVTHRVSIIMLPEQMALVTAGMSIQIKAAAAMGGQYLDTWQTRRVVEHQFEPRIDGRYWAHLNLDRSPHRRVPSKGTLSPSAITPHAAADLTDVDTVTTPPTDGQILIWDDTLDQWLPGDQAAGVPFDWFNVKTYGATGDGTTDDETAVEAAIAAINTAGKGVLYFPAGTYLIPGALTAITALCTVLGDGEEAWDQTGQNSSIKCTSTTAALFTVSSKRVTFRNLTLFNETTETAGAAIVTTSAYSGQRTNYHNLVIRGFYDGIDSQSGTAWVMDSCAIMGQVRYSVRIRNINNDDVGDWSISNSYLTATSGTVDAAIRIESSGGGKIVNTKINAFGGSSYTHGIDLNVANGISTVILNVTNCSIENVSDDGIHVVTAGTGTWPSIIINGNEFGLWGNNSGFAVSFNAASAGNLSEIVVSDNVFITNGTARSAVEIINVDNITLVGNVLDGFDDLYDQTTSTRIAAGANEPIWTPFTPVWTSETSGTPAIGNGTLTGAYISTGKTHKFRIHLTVGSTTTFGTGRWNFTVGGAPSTSGLALQVVACYMFDSSVATPHGGGAWVPAQAGAIVRPTAAGAGTINGISSAVPWTWATSDQLHIEGVIQIV